MTLKTNIMFQLDKIMKNKKTITLLIILVLGFGIFYLKSNEQINEVLAGNAYSSTQWDSATTTTTTETSTNILINAYGL